jgi:anaerobic selenocysteine-containing dehydrogenase
MKAVLTRREFLKLAGAGAAAALIVETGCSQLPLVSEVSQRVRGPLLRLDRLSAALMPLRWPVAARLLADTLRRYPPGEIAILTGSSPDHLNHLVHQLAPALGGAQVLHYDPQADFDGQIALLDATRRLLGVGRLPLFDLSSADLIFSFGSSLQEPWIARAAGLTPWELLANREAGSCLVHFSARRPAWLDPTDEWLPILPGSEAVLAAAIYRLAARLVLRDVQLEEPDHDTELAAVECGITTAQMRKLAHRFTNSPNCLAIPGGSALNGLEGTAAASWILLLNLLADPGRTGGFFLAPPSPIYPELPIRMATGVELEALVQQIKMGRIKALLMHGVDLQAALPHSSGLGDALAACERVISFDPIFNTTSPFVDLFLPDHAPHESWGYSQPAYAADYGLVQAIQPSQAPELDTRSTAGLLIAAGRAVGLSGRLPYLDEIDYLKRSLLPLMAQNGFFGSEDPGEFIQVFLEQGSWHRRRPVRLPPVQLLPSVRTGQPGRLASPGKDFRLLVFPPEQEAAEAGDFLHWVEIHPLAAARMGLRAGQQVRLVSASGEVRLPLRISSRLHPAALAIPFWNGSRSGSFPYDLLGRAETSSGGRVYSGTPLRIAV